MAGKVRVRVLEGWSVYVGDERRNGGDEVDALRGKTTSLNFAVVPNCRPRGRLLL